jgi:hypothetical protein
MATLTKKFSIVEVQAGGNIVLSSIATLLSANALKIYGPSTTTGGARQGYTPGVGGTLTTLVPGFGYEVVSKGTTFNWDLPGVRVLYGTDNAIPDVDGSALADLTAAITAAYTQAIADASAADRDRASHTGTQAASTITGLASVATSGSYADLSFKPTIPAAYTDAQAVAANTSAITTASTADRSRANHTGTQAASTITGLATVATSGSYIDLTNKPVIPAAYTDAQAVAANATAITTASTADRARANHTGTQAASTITGLATVATSGSYADLSFKPSIPAAYTDAQAVAANAAAITAANTANRDRTNHTGTQAASTITGLATVATSGSYADLSFKPSIPAAYTDAQAVAANATAITTASTADRSRANHTGTQAASTITGLSIVATSGSYADLTSKPTIPAAYTDALAVAANASAIATGDTNTLATLRGGVVTAGDNLAKLYTLIQTLNGIVGSTSPDADSIVNTVNELLAVFNNYPEGTNVLGMLASKVAVTDLVNNLTQTTAGYALDARQGKVLGDMVNFDYQDVPDDVRAWVVSHPYNTSNELATKLTGTLLTSSVRGMSFNDKLGTLYIYTFAGSDGLPNWCRYPTSNTAYLANAARSLTFRYTIGATDTSLVVVASEAGAYHTATLKNVGTATYYVNGVATTLANLSPADGDTVRLVITAADTTKSAYVVLTA